MRNTCAMVGLHRPVSRPPRRAPKPGRASRTRIVDHPANYKRVKHLELSSPSDMHQEHSPDLQRRWHSSLRILLPVACVFVAVSSIEALGYIPQQQLSPAASSPIPATAAATLKWLMPQLPPSLPPLSPPSAPSRPPLLQPMPSSPPVKQQQPPSPPLSATEAVALINRRFELGRPSSDAEAAGVFVRMIDHLTDTEDWAESPWLPSKDPNRADRFSGSVINRWTPAIFMGKYGRGMPGFVISPGAAHASIMCGFTHDVGTVMAQCHPPGRSATCLPGCMGASDSSRGISHWCDSPAPCSGLGGECNATGYGRHSFPTCPWPPQKLMELMERHVDEVAEATCSCCHWSDDANDCSLYNEIIFDAHILAKSQEYMLANIEAVFFPADRPRHVEDFAYEVHDALERHGIQVPLMRYNALVETNPEVMAAFTLVRGEDMDE